jgi:chromosome segregation ATPase
MLRATFLFSSLFFIPASLPAQSSEPQMHTMEAVLSEIRQLRQDLQSAAAATRKAQIVIYRLHVQAGVVERATQRLENVRNALAQMESQKKYLTEQLKRFEEMKDQTETEQQRKRFEENIVEFKASLEEMGPEMQDLQAKQIELEADLRTEQAKWERLQEELDRLENSLENSALQTSERR